MNPAIFAGVLAGLLAAARVGKRNTEIQDESSSALLAIMLWFLVGPIWLLVLGLLVEAIVARNFAEIAIRIPIVTLLTLVLFPWPITRGWLIPRGRVRAAKVLTSLSAWVWGGDIRGGSLIAAAWAAMRLAQSRGTAIGSEQPNELEWLDQAINEARSDATRWRLGAAGLVAAGLLAEAKGDRTQARRLLASAGELTRPSRPTRAIVIAWEWLCGDAMARGAWREVEFLTRTTDVESRNLAWFAVVAARLTGIAPVPNDLILQARWLVAPHRIANWPLLRRALAAPAAARKVDERTIEPEPVLVPEGPPLQVAMRLHARCLARDPSKLTRNDLATLARAWDAALADEAVGRQLEQRGEALGAHASARSTASLRDSVREDLLMLIQSAGLELGKLGDDSEILGHAARALESELLNSLEVSVGALESRVQAKRELPSMQEWQTFLAIREQYSEAVAVGGLVLRRVAFSTVHGPVCSLAVWLWNERREKAIANAMFRWLLSEAIIVDDAEAIRLQEKNVGCGV